MLSNSDLNSRLCSNVEYQKFILTLIQNPSLSQDQMDILLQNFANLYDIEASSVNITQRPNAGNINQDSDLIFSIGSGTGTDPSSIIYNFTQLMNQNPSKLSALFTNTNINTKIGTSYNVQYKPLTFNETVGTTQGCFKKSDSSTLNLFIGTSEDCSPVTSDSSELTDSITPTIIAAAIGVGVSIIIIIALLLIIPGTRNAIFKKSKKSNLDLK